jgi:hypothetical protein
MTPALPQLNGCSVDSTAITHVKAKPQKGCTYRLLCGRIRGQRGHSPILSIRGCGMDELERAADELEKATSELVRRAEELANRSEELNRQLLRLAEALTRPTMIRPREVTPDSLKPADTPGTGQTHQDNGILAEVKEFLDGTEGQAGLSGMDPRD